MSGLSSIGEADVLTPLTTTAYVSLHTADPGNAGGSEVSTTGTAYGRIGPITFANAGANPTVASNTGILTFNQATAAWGTIGFFGLWTSAAGASFLGSGPLTTPTPINNGDTARFLANSLTITVQ